MLSKMYNSLREENKMLLEENRRLSHKKSFYLDECQKLIAENVSYEKEIQFLKQRNKELRQKSWYEVFEENLKLAEEIKQYKAVLESVEKFVGRFADEKR
jgi:predicted nuclease with TOPRIM domain